MAPLECPKLRAMLNVLAEYQEEPIDTNTKKTRKYIEIHEVPEKEGKRRSKNIQENIGFPVFCDDLFVSLWAPSEFFATQPSSQIASLVKRGSLRKRLEGERGKSSTLRES